MKQLFWGAAAAIALAATPALAGTTIVSNSTPITVVDGGRTTSSLAVSGVGGTITDMTLTLTGLSHTYPDDLVLGLVNDDLKIAMVLFSGVGGSIDVNNVNLTFDDEASIMMPQSFVGGQLTSGTYLPSNLESYSLKNYLPLDPSYHDIANFNGFDGLSANGTWKLYVIDVFPADGGAISGGFSLSFTTTDVGGGNGGGAVPEPATWALMILGFGAVGQAARRRRFAHA